MSGKNWVDTGSRNVAASTKPTRKPDYVCGQCANFMPCPCGCKYGICDAMPEEGFFKYTDGYCDWFELSQLF